MSEPKFAIGEAVMVRDTTNPRFNSDFSVVVDVMSQEQIIEKYVCTCRKTGVEVKLKKGWYYFVSTMPKNKPQPEDFLHPLPPEQGTSWDNCVWQPKELATTGEKLTKTPANS